jgi:hypothetical protein
MALLASTVIDLVRQQIGDTIEEYRFADTELLDALTNANRQLADDRNDLQLTAAGAITPVVDVTSLTQELIFAENMTLPLAHYTSQVILTKDSENDQNMKLAGFHLNKYNSII